MSVLDLHPEELLDRSVRGTLTPVESERLERHLERCESCRLEQRVRGDFRDEEEPLGDDFDVQRLLSEVLAPGVDRLGEPAARSPEPRRRSTWLLGSRRLRPMLLVAAALLVAGVSAAAGWTGMRDRQSRLAVAEAAPLAPRTESRPKGAKSAGHGGVTKELELPVDTPEPVPAAVAPLASASPSTGQVATAREGSPTAHLTPPAPIGVSPAAVVPAVHPPAPFTEPRAVSGPLGIGGTEGASSAASARVSLLAPDNVSALDAEGLFSRANRARRAGDHERATELYRSLVERYPASAEAHEAKAVLGRVLLGEGEASSALRFFDAYLERGGSLREDVMADRAVALSRLAREHDEAEAWTALLEAYPNSVHAERARARLRELKGP